MPTTSPPRKTAFRDDLLKGQVAIVSGGGSGLGCALAIEMSKLGAKIAVCGRRAEPLEETARLIAEAGGESVLAKAMSIRDPDAGGALVSDVYERFGRLDILVNNAGGQFPRLRSTSQPRVGMRSSTPISTARGT